MKGIVHSICFGVALMTIVFVVNASMFFILLCLKLLLPSKIYWSLTKYCYTQYHWKWLLFNMGKIKVKFEGESDSLPKGEPALMFSNHQDDLDFGIFLITYMETGIRSTETKWVAKKTVSYIPFFGWVHWLVGDLFLRRSWETDSVLIKEWLSEFKARQFKKERIVIFPEGTRSRNKQKLEESQEFAKKHGLPVLSNVIYPRTKGFSMMAKYFRDHPGTVDHVYDYTFGYYPSGVGIGQFAQGPIPVDIHVHVSRHKIADIGNDEADFAAWCVRRFQVKDKLLAYFEKHHEFPSNKEAAQIEKNLLESQ